MSAGARVLVGLAIALSSVLAAAAAHPPSPAVGGTITGWVAGLSRVDAADVRLLVDGAPSIAELGPDSRFRHTEKRGS